MTEPELFPPKGYYRADEAYRHWMEVRFDHRQLTHEEIDETRQQFLSWLRTASSLVNVFTRDGHSHDIPSSAWDLKFFPDLLLLHKSIPLIKGSPFEGYAGAILIISRGELNHWATTELRDELFDELSYGRMELSRARMIAAKAGIESLEGNPDPSNYKPMAEPYWSLPMAVAWIATRNAEQVRERWNKYLEKCFYFHHGRWRLGPDGEIHTGWKCDNRRLASINLFFGDDKFALAKSTLFLALKQNEIVATGLTEQGIGRKLIPNHEWQDLSCPTINGKDVFRPAAGVAGYMEVTVARDSVLAKWPAPIAIWDFALAKRNNDKDLTGRLVGEIYAAFWNGELGINELSLTEDKLFNQPGVDTLNELSREYLAGCALGKIGEEGYSIAFDQLAKWNIADYAKVDAAYRYYFVPEDGIGSLGSQGRGLSAPPDVLEAWTGQRHSQPLAIESKDPTIQESDKPPLDLSTMTTWARAHMLKNKASPTTKREEMNLIAATYPAYRVTRARYTDARKVAAESANMSWWLKHGPKEAGSGLGKTETASSPEFARTNYADELRNKIKISKEKTA